MKHKIALILTFVLLVNVAFVSSVAYPVPEVCKSVTSCPEGYKLAGEVIFYNAYSDVLTKTDNCGEKYKCVKIKETISIVEAGNIQSNLQSKMGSSVGTTSIATEDFALRQELDNPLELKKKEDCNKSNGCYKEKLCFSTGDIINLTYCFKGQFINQRAWGNLCEKDFECIESFCYEGRCYRGGKNKYINSLQNNLNELEERINLLEEDSVVEENNSKITGEVVSNLNESWIEKVWKNIFTKIFN